MKKFKLWILEITIALWKRKLRSLHEQTRKATVKLTLVQAMHTTILKEGNDE